MVSFLIMLMRRLPNERWLGHVDKIVVPMIKEFNEVPEIEGLQSPRWEDGYLDISF